jgi:hypothetical protein
MSYCRSGSDILGHNLIPAVPDGASPSMTSGFTWIPAGDGAPTGIPSNSMIRHSVVPMYFCKKEKKLYIYSGSEWLSSVPFGKK